MQNTSDNMNGGASSYPLTEFSTDIDDGILAVYSEHVLLVVSLLSRPIP